MISVDTGAFGEIIDWDWGVRGKPLPTLGSGNWAISSSLNSETDTTTYCTFNCVNSAIAYVSDDLARGAWTITQVPEPSTLALLGAGLLGLVYRRRVTT